MKILHLSPRFHFPPDDGGKIVIANTYKHFSRLGADIHYFCFNDTEIGKDILLEANKYGYVDLYEHCLKNNVGKAIKSFITNQSIYLMKHFSDEILNYLYELHKNKQFDVIHCEHSAMAPLGIALKKQFGIPCGLRLHNIEYKIWELYAKELPIYNPLKYYIQLQYRLLRNSESKIYKDVDVCFTITEDDRKYAKILSPDANIINSGVGVDFDKFNLPKESIEKSRNTMILATTYKWIHNVNGLDWFISNVMPLVLKEIPDAKLLLLGKSPPEKYKNMQSSGIELVGYVDDVLPYFHSAAIYIAPLFVGAGVRIKILEAMAAGLPVVATKVSAAGIPTDEANGLFVSDCPRKTAESIIELMKNPQKATTLGRRANQYISDNYSWSNNVSIMYQFYKNLIEAAT